MTATNGLLEKAICDRWLYLTISLDPLWREGSLREGQEIGGQYT